MSFEYAEVPLAEVVDLAMDEFRSAYRERQLQLHLELGSDLPSVIADRMRMLQVVRNLISNAAKFTPAGGHVRVMIEAAPLHQRVVVEDSGIGIPKGEEALIFNKFTQASHTNPRTGGTGLGLAICREIVLAHEGRIWAENRDGGGARLIFEIPVAGPAAAAAAAVHDAAAVLDPAAPAGESDEAGASSASSVAATRATNANDRWKRAA